MMCSAHGFSTAGSKKTSFFNALSAARFACETFTVLPALLRGCRFEKGGPDGQA